MGRCYDFRVLNVTLGLASSDDATTHNILYTSAQVEGPSIEGLDQL